MHTHVAGTVASTDRVRANEWIAFVWSALPGALLASAAAAGLIPEWIAISLFALSFVGLNLMHMGATWTRVYVRPAWKTKPIERLFIPIALATLAVAYESIGGGALLLGAQYYLSFHHGLMQNYGLLRVSQRRSRRTPDTRLDMAACLLFPGAALLYRARMVSENYSGAILPAAPMPLIEAMGVLGVVALLAFGLREWRAYHSGEDVDPLGAGIVFGTNLVWSALLVGNSHPAMPLYAIASAHYIQYLYFVWRTESGEPLPAADSGLGTRVRSVLRSSPARYLVIMLALGGSLTVVLTIFSGALRAGSEWLHLRPADALAIPAWTAAMIGINFEHYWLDHRIWRAPRPEVGVAHSAA